MPATQTNFPLTRRGLLLGAGALGLTAGQGRARAGEASARRFFRIASGSSGGMYYPLAGLISAAISNPTGDGDCSVEAVCGVPGLMAVAQTSAGSLDNLERLLSRQVESAFCQADLALLCAKGEVAGLPLDLGKRLRAIGYLYPEVLHVVTRKGAGITLLADLVGKRVSLGARGSGTDRDAAVFLESFGLAKGSVARANLGSVAAAREIREGKLDAFLLVSGVPANTVSSLAQDQLVSLLPLSGIGVDRFVHLRPPYRASIIQSGIYPHVAATPSLSVGALWLVTEDLPAELVYEITRSLWSQSTTDYLAQNDTPLGPQISLDNALTDIGTPPLHQGAERFYEEVGLLSA